MDRHTHTFTHRSGFTLIELLAVMMIIGILITTVTTAYVGMQRGAGMREAVNQLRSTLILARQKAITDGGKVNLYFFKNGQGVVEYYIVQSIGVATQGTSGKVLKDYLNPELKYLTNAVLYRIDKNMSARTEEKAPKGADGQYYVVLNKANVFAYNQRYGIKLHTSATLPLGFEFAKGDSPEDMNMFFYSDGSVEGPGGLPPVEIEIFETIAPSKTITLTMSKYGMLGAKESF